MRFLALFRGRVCIWSTALSSLFTSQLRTISRFFPSSVHPEHSAVHFGRRYASLSFNGRCTNLVLINRLRWVARCLFSRLPSMIVPNDLSLSGHEVAGENPSRRSQLKKRRTRSNDFTLAALSFGGRDFSYKSSNTSCASFITRCTHG